MDVENIADTVLPIHDREYTVIGSVYTIDRFLTGTLYDRLGGFTDKLRISACKSGGNAIVISMLHSVDIELKPSFPLYQPNRNLAGKTTGNTPEAFGRRQIEPNDSPTGTIEQVELRAYVLRSIR